VNVFDMWQELEHYIGQRTTGTKAGRYAMGSTELDESDLGESALAELVAEPRNELETGRSSADNNDFIVVARRRHKIRTPPVAAPRVDGRAPFADQCGWR
jgi:hypothetical protein